MQLLKNKQSLYSNVDGLLNTLQFVHKLLVDNMKFVRGSAELEHKMLGRGGVYIYGSFLYNASEFYDTDKHCVHNRMFIGPCIIVIVEE